MTDIQEQRLEVYQKRYEKINQVQKARRKREIEKHGEDAWKVYNMVHQSKSTDKTAVNDVVRKRDKPVKSVDGPKRTKYGNWYNNVNKEYDDFFNELCEQAITSGSKSRGMIASTTPFGSTCLTDCWLRTALR